MKLIRTPQPFHGGEVVVIDEPGIRPWTAKVEGVKWSHVSGWWVEVRREGEPGVWVMPLARVGGR